MYSSAQERDGAVVLLGAVKSSRSLTDSNPFSCKIGGNPVCLCLHLSLSFSSLFFFVSLSIFPHLSFSDSLILSSCLSLSLSSGLSPPLSSRPSLSFSVFSLLPSLVSPHTSSACSQEWFNHTAPSDYAAAASASDGAIQCKLCGSEMDLALQLLASVGFPRSLLLFACLRPGCVETSDAWRCFRSQVQPQAAPGAAEADAVDAAPPPPTTSGWEQALEPTVAAGKPREDDADAVDSGSADAGFGGGDTGGGAGWGDAGEWGLDSDDDDGDDDKAAEAAAAAVAAALAITATATATATATTTTAATTTPFATPTDTTDATAAALSATPARLVQFEVTVFDEPYDGGAPDVAAAQALQQKYESEHGSVTDAGAAAASGKGRGSSDAPDDVYEKLPPQEKYLLRFQRRIAREAAQCIRYAWEGRPLWCAPPPPDFEVPPCPCGRQRLFELQVLPTLVNHLRLAKAGGVAVAGVPPPAPPSAPRTAAAAGAGAAAAGAADSAVAAGAGELNELTLLSLDWETVAVFSCPASCRDSSEEYVFVR